MTRVLCVFGLLLLCGACQSTSGPNAARSARPSETDVAIVTAAEAVESCSFVQTVAVDPPFALLTRSYPEMTFMSRTDLQRLLRREAAYAGADTVLPTGFEDGQMHGRTYTCAPSG